jgi:Fur family peroxide stress response transcriptional regulator
VRLFREVCGKAHVRATQQRLDVLREIIRAKDHPTVETVWDRVRRRVPSISLNTVYRTLDMFEKHGVVLRLRMLDDPVRYDGRWTLHHHMICRKCKRILDFDWPDFDKAVLPALASQWGTVVGRQVQVVGLCRDCLRGKSSRQS